MTNEAALSSGIAPLMQIFVSIDILYKELTSNEAWKINDGPFEVLFERERERER